MTPRTPGFEAAPLLARQDARRKNIVPDASFRSAFILVSRNDGLNIPAVESQAVDRAHRIGRIKKIIAYRLITAGTIEEKILRLKEHKRNLADTLIRADEGGLDGLSEEEVRALFSR